MEPAQYLIDTNAIIDYLGKKFSPNGMTFMNDVIDVIPNVSIITKIEVLGFNTLEKHYQILENLMNDAIIIDLTSYIADMTIIIRKTCTIKLPDAIAATALVKNLTLITHNKKDFKNIKGLKIIDAHEI